MSETTGTVPWFDALRRKLGWWRRELRFRWKFRHEPEVVATINPHPAPPATVARLRRRVLTGDWSGAEEREPAPAPSQDWEVLAHHFADQLVEWWHIFEPAGTPPTLAMFMGLTEEEYSAWVECRFADLASAVASRASHSQDRGEA